jgi:catechol 2,3-dioxygenase
MQAHEPVMDIAHLGHVELLTPKPEESLRFFTDVMGMTVSGRKGDSVFLRGWDDYERYSLQLTAYHTSGLGHAAFRTRSAAALERRIAALRTDGVELTPHEDNLGHGLAKTGCSARARMEIGSSQSGSREKPSGMAGS